jgi:hypothetical protein
MVPKSKKSAKLLQPNPFNSRIFMSFGEYLNSLKFSALQAAEFLNIMRTSYQKFGGLLGWCCVGETCENGLVAGRGRAVDGCASATFFRCGKDPQSNNLSLSW